ncbi:MAG: hypothetical protein NDI63_13585, partial [Pseudobdellovibrio sp.]|nr:hypothetical protein [Pseudobdellovibrio sp.]
MRQSTKSSSSKRGSSSSTPSRRSGTGRSTTGSASRSSSRDEDRYGAMGARMSSRDEYDMGRSDYGRGVTYGSDYGRRGSSYGTGSDYGREGVRTISGRYSDFEDYGGSSRDREYRDDSERGFARGGRRGEYS